MQSRQIYQRRQSGIAEDTDPDLKFFSQSFAGKRGQIARSAGIGAFV